MAAAGAQWFAGIPGLFLDIDYLSDLGADSQFLHWWEHGRPLDGGAILPESRSNHPSLLVNAEWADREWGRLEQLGKVEFFPKNAPKPDLLNINPCALLLKMRDGIDEDTPYWEQFKARLICDLSRGQVNEHMPRWQVAYGTVDIAISRLVQGGWMFVIDLADAFLNWKVEPSDTWALGFSSAARRQYGRYLFLPL